LKQRRDQPRLVQDHEAADRSLRLRKRAAALLLATALASPAMIAALAVPARAQTAGGNGGVPTGGSLGDPFGATGGNGGSFAGGGGGGSGGGSGGAGVGGGVHGGGGGAGFGGGGGGGGVGGSAGDNVDGFTISANTAMVNTGMILGGAGGGGGAGGALGGGGGAGVGGGGGGGTSGGVGGSVIGNVTISANSGTIQGGAGGTIPGGTGVGGGGDGVGSGGAGASGGAGGTITGSIDLDNLPGGLVQGGNGGVHAGAGGVGVRGANVTIINAGTIAGGLNGDGTRADAIIFTGGTNSLELQAGYVIIGNVVGPNAISNTLILGGANSASFDVSQIAPAGSTAQQYQDFSSLQKNGTSEWTLTGTQTSTAPWTVNQGDLVVNGSIETSIETTVKSGAALHGTGIVGNTNVEGGGFLVPGTVGVPGTMLTVAGNLALQPGSHYVVELNPTTSTFTNVTGIATLAGTVDANFLTGTYLNHEYTILTATGGVSGTFDHLAIFGFLPANFLASLRYTGTSALLDIVAELVPEPPQPPPGREEIPEIPGGPALPERPPGPFFTEDELQVGHAIDDFFNHGGMLPPQFVNLFNLTGASLANALTQLDGEVATGAERSSFQLMNGFLNLMLDPTCRSLDDRADDPLCRNGIGITPNQQASLPPDLALAYAAVFKAPPKEVPSFEQRWTAWAAAFGGGASASGDPIIGSDHVRTGTFGYAAGMDYHMLPGTVLGFALAGGGTGWGLAQGLGSGRSDALLAGVYGVTHQGPAYLAGSLAFANNWFSTDRTALGDQLTARFQGQSYAARIEGGFRFELPSAYNAVGITPYTAIQAQNFRTPDYSETDLTGGGFGLNYAAMSSTDTRTEWGARFDDLTAVGGLPLILRGRVAWAHDFVSNPALNASFLALPGSSFTVFGAPIPRDSALTSVSAQLFFAPNWSVLVKFDGEFASASQTYAGTGTIRYTW